MEIEINGLESYNRFSQMYQSLSQLSQAGQLSAKQEAEMDDLSDALQVARSNNYQFANTLAPNPRGLSGKRKASTVAARVKDPTDDVLDYDLGVAIQCSLLAKLDNKQPADIAIEVFGNERVANDLSANTYSAGGSWVQGAYAERFIQLLTPNSVVRAMGGPVLTLEDGTMSVPKAVLGPSGRYLGELEAALAEDATTGDVKLLAKEMVSLIAITDKLARSPSANATNRVRDMVLSGAAATEDLYFLRGVAAGAGPTGLRYLMNTANVITANATLNLANTTHDLGRLDLRLLNANIAMRIPAYIMHPQVLVYLMGLRDGSGHLAFPSLSLERPRLRNKPVFTTTQIPINLGGSGDQTEIYLCDAYHIVIGDSGRIGLETSNVAAYLNSAGTMKAAFSERKTVIRLVLEHDIALEHDKTVGVLLCNWGTTIDD